MTTATAPTALSELAPRYLAGGLSLVPCSAETKRPDPELLPRDDEAGKATWKPYQKRAGDGAKINPRLVCPRLQERGRHRWQGFGRAVGNRL